MSRKWMEIQHTIADFLEEELNEVSKVKCFKISKIFLPSQSKTQIPRNKTKKASIAIFVGKTS